MHDFERYIISFGLRSLEEAERWPDLLRILKEKVKPERERPAYASAPWWLFWRPRPELHSALVGLDRCLVTSVVSKHLTFAFQPTNRVFSHRLTVFPLDRFAQFAVLQSRMHVPWAWLLSSPLEERLNYSPSDCFDTFPFPTLDPRALPVSLDALGEALYTARARYMVETNQGLTQTYNRLKDPTCAEPAIVELRRLHEELDRAVLAAYREHAGWPEIAVPPYGTPTTDAERRALEAFEDEVIDRLFQLNAERAAEEAAAAPAKTKKAGKKKKVAGGAKKTKASKTQTKLVEGAE